MRQAIEDPRLLKAEFNGAKNRRALRELRHQKKRALRFAKTGAK